MTNRENAFRFLHLLSTIWLGHHDPGLWLLFIPPSCNILWTRKTSGLLLYNNPRMDMELSYVCPARDRGENILQGSRTYLSSWCWRAFKWLPICTVASSCSKYNKKRETQVRLKIILCVFSQTLTATSFSYLITYPSTRTTKNIMKL